MTITGANTETITGTISGMSTGNVIGYNSRILLAGFGLANQAVAKALVSRGHSVTAFDDHDTMGMPETADELGIGLHIAPSEMTLRELIDSADILVPTPGLPETHPIFDMGSIIPSIIPSTIHIASELDLAQSWDNRPMVAITGTSGKTTVTEGVTAALNESGIAAMAAGNNETPLVEAINNTDVEVFVVEASSFRLAHSQSFTPDVACWLNFGPDHLDVHSSVNSYENAKAKIFAHSGKYAIANASDTTVMDHFPRCEDSNWKHLWTFSQSASTDWHLDDNSIVGPDGASYSLDELGRDFVHDIDNALAIAAVATAAGANPEGIQRALVTCNPGPHRLELVDTHKGVRYYNDSKATTPHATLAALKNFSQTILIAGGRNKGLDMSVLASQSDQTPVVLAFGEAADDIVNAFENRCLTVKTQNLHHATYLANAAATPGSVVLFSPACASFDSYSNYAERGDHFKQLVTDLTT